MAGSDDSSSQSSISPLPRAATSGLRQRHAGGAVCAFPLASSSLAAPFQQKVPAGLCQVPSCCADLAAAKFYHRRYKICEMHARQSEVLLQGLPQRFCQQCGRFHPLSAFDGACKSCRKELEAHNKRRRKVGPAPPLAHAMPCAPPHATQQRPRAPARSLLALADAFDLDQPAAVLEAPPKCCAEHRAPRSARPAKRPRPPGADSPPPPTPPPTDVAPAAPPLPPQAPQAPPLPLLPFAGDAIAAALSAEASRQVGYLLSGGAPTPAGLILLAPLLQAMALRAAQQQQTALAAPAVSWQGHPQQQPAVLAALVAQSLFAGHALRR